MRQAFPPILYKPVLPTEFPDNLDISKRVILLRVSLTSGGVSQNHSYNLRLHTSRQFIVGEV